MVPPELIKNLNLIAIEGWEYHKLPLETLNYTGDGVGSWTETAGASKSTRPRYKKMLLPAGASLTGQTPG